MSDESSRSARPSGQRRNDGAPAWWPALERVDLPDDDEGVPAAHRRWYEDQKTAAAASPEAPAPTQPVHRQRPAWVVNTLVFLAVALVLMVAVGVADSDYDLLTVTMLVGVPLILVVMTTLIVARRSR